MTTSYKGRRDKGIVGEREVMRVLTDAGFDVRGLEGKGDHLAMKEEGPRFQIRHYLFHIEVKRQETLRPDEWSHQSEAEAPQGSVPVVVYRRSREPWRVSIKLDDLLRLLG